MTVREFKQNLLNQLYEPYKKCMLCPLSKLGRTQVVFGEGNPDARLVLIGEGPGAQEDALGRPFVGRSGKLLDRLLDAVGIIRSEVFITNVVKCRPPGNRKPLPIESNTCKSILLTKQVKIIKPRIICTLGATAFEGLLGKQLPMKIARTQEFMWEDSIVIPTFHPAYILRNQKELESMLSDLQKVATLIME